MYEKRLDDVIWILKSLPCGVTLDQMEACYTISILGDNKGNRMQTSKDLKLPVRTLRKRLERYEHEGYQFPEGRNGRNKKVVSV